MRLIVFSAQLVDLELQVHFGKILPIELPVANEILLKHIDVSSKKYFNKKTLIIPEGYDLRNIEVIENWEVLRVQPGLKLIDIYRYVADIFENERIFIHYGDSLFKFEQSFLKEDCIIVSESRFNYNWGSLDENLIFTGGVTINTNFLRQILDLSSSFTDLLVGLKSKLKILPTSHWLDFGHAITFFESRKAFLESRIFNELSINEGFLIKKSEDKFKIFSEYEWLRKLKVIIPRNIPDISEFNFCNENKAQYGIEYLKYPSIAELYVFSKNNEFFFENILKELKQVLSKIRDTTFLKPKNDVPNLFTEKLVERKKNIYQIIEQHESDGSEIQEIYQSNLSYFQSKQLQIGIIHGDFCFSNILFDISSHTPFLIDPRGYISRSSEPSIFGPLCYDEIKLAHSYICQYDYIISNEEVDFDSFVNRLEIFKKHFLIENELLRQGLINLFLTMIPLHSDSISRQMNFLKMVKFLNKQEW